MHAYLGSADYNGLAVTALPPGWDAQRLRALVSDGLVQVVTDADYPNMHIKPWPSRRSVDDQIADIEAVLAATGYCCLYPTPTAMADWPLPALEGKPYELQVARGAGALELVHFEMAAFEPYRNDPRYHFQLDDFGFSFGIGDDAYFDTAEPDHDKIHTVRAGFSFEKAKLDVGVQDLTRYGCAFLTDLWKMTPRHQERLRTWEVDGTGLKPHPTWWRMQMGHWAEHIGPFEKILGEIEALNEIWTLAFGIPIFRTADRPREWGWVLRASTNEWDAFILATDKLLSENLLTAGLDAAGAPTSDEKGNHLGTLARFERLIIKRTTVAAADVRDAFRPLRDVRKQRQKPAHATAEPLTDRTVFEKQRKLLADIAVSLQATRRLLQRHPKVRAAGWEPSHLDDWWTL